MNLVHNSIEAMETLAGRNRLLRVKTDRHGRDAVIVVVEDLGPGIEPTRLHGIFEAFVTTKKKGMGLGLAICRQIIENHGGKLTVFSDGNSGARFHSFYQSAPKMRQVRNDFPREVLVRSAPRRRQRSRLTCRAPSMRVCYL